MEDLEWSSQDSLENLLEVLAAVAPFHMLQPQQEQDPSWSSEEAVGGLQSLLQLLQPVVRSSKRLSATAAQQLVGLFFHPALFSNE